MKNNTKAFPIFLKAVKDVKKFPWTESKIRTIVPESLVVKPSNVGVKKFYYKKLRERKKWLSQIYTLTKKTVKKYGKFIVECVEKYTKLRWRYREVLLIPSILYMQHKNVILIGFPRPWQSKEYFMHRLIHELIHANTIYIPGLRYPMDSNEVATVLLENKIIGALNEKFNLNFKSEWFYLKKLGIGRHKRNLIKIGKTKKTFAELIKEVDDYLRKKKYKRTYFKL